MSTITPIVQKQKTPLTLRDHMETPAFAEAVAKALPKHITPDRFIRVALTAITKTPKLMECEQATVFSALLTCSQLGIEPDGRRAHLIPYGKQCQLIIDYKGLIELAKRSGEVAAWSAELVKENDEFSWENGVVTHSIDWRNPRGKTQCVYSRVKLSNGTLDFEVMTLEEVDAIRKRSRASASGPWVTDYDEMAKKTVIRRHSKRLTLSPEFRDAVAADDDSLDIDTKIVSDRPRGMGLTEMIAGPTEEVQSANRDEIVSYLENYILETGVSSDALLKEVTAAKLVENPDNYALFELPTATLVSIRVYVASKVAST